MKAYIIHGGHDGGHDDPSDALQPSDSLSIMFPENGWEDIRKLSIRFQIWNESNSGLLCHSIC